MGRAIARDVKSLILSLVLGVGFQVILNPHVVLESGLLPWGHSGSDRSLDEEGWTSASASYIEQQDKQDLMSTYDR